MTEPGGCWKTSATSMKRMPGIIQIMSIITAFDGRKCFCWKGSKEQSLLWQAPLFHSHNNQTKLDAKSVGVPYNEWDHSNVTLMNNTIDMYWCWCWAVLGWFPCQLTQCSLIQTRSHGGLANYVTPFVLQLWTPSIPTCTQREIITDKQSGTW